MIRKSVVDKSMCRENYKVGCQTHYLNVVGSIPSSVIINVYKLTGKLPAFQVD